MADTQCHVPQIVGTGLRKQVKFLSITLVQLPTYSSDILSVSQMRDAT